MKPKPLNVRMQGVLLAIGIHGIAVAREPANRKLLQEVYRADRFGLWREAYTELRAYRMSDDEINQIVAPIYSEPPPASSPDDYGTSKVIPIKTRAAGPKPNGHANRAEPHQGLPKEEVIAETTAAIEPGEKPKRPPKKDGKAATSEPAVVIIPAVVPPSIWPDHDKGGEPKRTYRNARFAIAALGVTCRLDLFHNRKLIGEHVVDRWAGQLSDSACYALRQAIIDAYGFDPGKDNTNDAAISLCIEHHPFDPVMEYIDSLVWDGTQRLGIWLSYYLGAEDTPLNREIGKLVLVAAIRRARKPGTKFDHMLVLEGPEGRMKSTVILVLAGEDNFSDQTILGQRDKEQQELVAGVWLYEIPELAGMPKAEIEKVKAFITRTHDRARGAYERHRVDTPRRCIFIGTTNEDTYLRSQTGNRRFWPIKVGSIDIEALREDRDQLWAEAAKVEATG
ncbi:MAG TPA: virulence-associated E family protein, partial [Xanthobacteraceae bacterium]